MFDYLFDRRFLYDVLFGDKQAIPNLKMGKGELYDKGLPMGIFAIGKQGAGKSTWIAMHILSFMHRNLNAAIFILDWSGSITNILFDLISREPSKQAQKDMNRIIYAEPGHPSTIVPMPEFSFEYGLPMESQIRRVQKNWFALSQMFNAEILAGVLINGLIPRVLEVFTSIGKTPYEMWQVTELEMAMSFPKIYFPKLFSSYPDKFSESTKELLLKRLINLPAKEAELRTYALTKILNQVKSDSLSPSLGYNRPGWTPREAINNGNVVLINGQRLVGQTEVQHYAFTQIHSIIMDEINQRDPGASDEPILYVLDEVLTAKDNPGMADDLAKIPSQYRSRGVCLHLCGQGLWQFNEDLQKAIWNMGNLVCFSLDNYDDAFAVAQQLSVYRPQMVKSLQSRYPHAETEKGQTVMLANFIQGLRKRECIMRRYWSESERDPQIIHVRKTKEITGYPQESVETMKERLLKKRGLPVSEALKLIKSRTLSDGKQMDVVKV